MVKFIWIFPLRTKFRRHYVVGLLTGGKTTASIIRATGAFDSKFRGFWRVSDFVSAYLRRNKNFFRKIEICRKLLSFCAEKDHGFQAFFSIGSGMPWKKYQQGK